MPRIRRDTPAAIAVTLMTFVTAAACGGSDDGGPAANPGSIVVAASPATLSVDQGTGASSTITLTRVGGFSRSVFLTVSGLPTGVTATITPNELTGGTTTATINLTVAAAVPSQAYTATITGSATGVPVATTTLALNVTARPAGSTDVVYDYCGEDTAPVFLAYQDGNDAWRAVRPTGAGWMIRFAFKLEQSRGGVIAVYAPPLRSTTSARIAGRRFSATRTTLRTLGSGRVAHDGQLGRARTPAPSRPDVAYTTEIRFASARELAEVAAETCRETSWTKQVKAVVNGVGAGQYGILSLGPSNALFVGGESNNPVTFSDVPDGALDFVAARLATPGSPPDRVVVLRNLNVDDGGSLPATIDFNAASSLPATASVTVQGGAGEELEIFSEVVTARSGRSLLWFDLAPSRAATRPWAGLAAGSMVSGDFHSVVAFASSASEGDFRVALKYVGAVSDQTLTLGPMVSAPSISVVASSAYPRLRFQGDLPTEYANGFAIVLGDEEAGNTFSIAATGAYITAVGNVRRYDLVMPDVLALDGFPAGSRLTAGPNDFSMDAFGFTGPGVFDLIANLGSEYKAAVRAGSFAVP